MGRQHQLLPPPRMRTTAHAAGTARCRPLNPTCIKVGSAPAAVGTPARASASGLHRRTSRLKISWPARQSYDCSNRRARFGAFTSCAEEEACRHGAAETCAGSPPPQPHPHPSPPFTRLAAPSPAQRAWTPAAARPASSATRASRTRPAAARPPGQQGSDPRNALPELQQRPGGWVGQRGRQHGLGMVATCMLVRQLGSRRSKEIGACGSTKLREEGGGTARPHPAPAHAPSTTHPPVTNGLSLAHTHRARMRQCTDAPAHPPTRHNRLVAGQLLRLEAPHDAGVDEQAAPLRHLHEVGELAQRAHALHQAVCPVCQHHPEPPALGLVDQLEHEPAAGGGGGGGWR